MFRQVEEPDERMTESSVRPLSYVNAQTHATAFGAPFPEWGEPSAQSPLRQGDVLAAVSPKAGSWRELLIVITADCDLAKDKHDGALTCVPVLELESYLLAFRYEKMREPLVSRMADRVVAALSVKDAEVLVPKITPTRLRQWVMEESTESIIEALSAFDFDEGALAILAQLRSICVAQPDSVPAAVEALGACKVVLQDAKTHDKGRSAVAADFASAVKKLPGDVLFLNAVSSGHSGGYIAYLRRVVEIADSCVARSYARLPREAEFVRVSRLRPPYVYAITQQFAAVFSAIGLPVEYEQARDAFVQNLRNGSLS